MMGDGEGGGGCGSGDTTFRSGTFRGFLLLLTCFMLLFLVEDPLDQSTLLFVHGFGHESFSCCSYHTKIRAAGMIQ